MLRNGPKRTISVSGGLELLQMVSKQDTGRCASEDTGPPSVVDCEIIGWRGEGSIPYKGVTTSP